MSEEFLQFSKPTINQATIDEVTACLRSGWITTGPRVQKFGQMLKDYLGAHQALPLASGTAALHLCLLALDLQQGDEVITPALTFVATANTIVMAGGKPVFVDVEPDTYNIDPQKIEDAITLKTKAIIPVHFAGIPVNLDAIYDIAKRHNLRVIEDAAQAIGTEYDGKKIGGFGDTQIFSFHPNKNITTGEGGCVTTFDDELAKEVNIRKFHGIDRDAWNRFTKQGSQHYDIAKIGFKYNMMDIQAAIGIHQLPQLDSFIAKRKKLAERYLECLGNQPEWQMPSIGRAQDKHSWHLFTPLLNLDIAKMSRDDFISAMKSYNIGVGFHYDAVHLFTYYRETYGYKPGDFPVTEDITQRIVSLPLFPLMTEDEQTKVIDSMKKVFTKE
jgi:dTDP-4-amino-4,6-dideoxygalactose transaminase